MKKFYNYFILLALLGSSQLAIGQFYDGFAGTGYIGGNCTAAAAGCASNGWLTHSVTSTSAATIDITSPGLSYTGLEASTGGKISIVGSNVVMSRDVNAAVTITGTVAYFSVLINVADATNLHATNSNYFMHFSTLAGNTGLSIFPGRLGIKQGSSVSNYHFSVMNNSGGTYTECATDLTFGTTYLVVLKFDMTVNKATIWVNPTSLGGAEPTGGTENATSTTTVTTLAAICIRNAYDGTTTLCGTPKADIDEIRVGTTWASVTPQTTEINEVSTINKLSVFPVPATSTITISANEPVNQIQIFDLQGRLVKELNNINTNETQIDVNALTNGVYNIVATSKNGNVFNSKLIK